MMLENKSPKTEDGKILKRCLDDQKQIRSRIFYPVVTYPSNKIIVPSPKREENAFLEKISHLDWKYQVNNTERDKNSFDKNTIEYDWQNELNFQPVYNNFKKKASNFTIFTDLKLKTKKEDIPSKNNKLYQNFLTFNPTYNQPTNTNIFELNPEMGIFNSKNVIQKKIEKPKPFEKKHEEYDDSKYLSSGSDTKLIEVDENLKFNQSDYLKDEIIFGETFEFLSKREKITNTVVQPAYFNYNSTKSTELESQACALKNLDCVYAHVLELKLDKMNNKNRVKRVIDLTH